MAEQRQRLTAKGLVEGRDFSLLDEVRKPSGHATGKHVHLSFSQPGIEGLGGRRGDDATEGRVRSNADRIGGGGRTAAGPPLSSGPVSNDNSRSVNQNIAYNTTISAQDDRAANSMYKRTHEQLAGMQLAHAKTVVR